MAAPERHDDRLHVRLPTDLRHRLQHAAIDQGTTATAITVRALTGYLDGYESTAPPRSPLNFSISTTVVGPIESDVRLYWRAAAPGGPEWIACDPEGGVIGSHAQGIRQSCERPESTDAELAAFDDLDAEVGRIVKLPGTHHPFWEEISPQAQDLARELNWPSVPR